MTSPLDSFKSAAVTTNDFRVEPLPSASAMVKQYGLNAGLQQWDIRAEEWRQRLERAINERLAAKEATVSKSGP